MDPISNQQTNNQQTQPIQAGQSAGIQQPAATQVPPPSPATTMPAPSALPPTSYTSTETDKNNSGGGKKRIAVLLIILIIVILGMGAYVLFARYQLDTKNPPYGNTVNILPTATVAPIPTPASVEEIQIEDPAAELDSLDKDVQEL